MLEAENRFEREKVKGRPKKAVFLMKHHSMKTNVKLLAQIF